MSHYAGAISTFDLTKHIFTDKLFSSKTKVRLFMNFIRSLERKFGRFAIRNLMLYLTVIYGVGFILSVVSPLLYYTYLNLDVGLILKGQIWRLVTWIVYPPSTSLYFGLLMLYVYYSFGTSLERVWGAFRFNLFIFMGMIFHILAAFICYFAFGLSGYDWIITPENLNMSIFLAFAFTFPDVQFLAMFIIPIRAKAMAYIYIIVMAVQFYIGSNVSRLTIGLSILNFIVFYLATRNWNRAFDVKRKQDFRVKIKPAGHVHRCCVCNRTEKDNPDLEFRYCSKCNGSFEYCSEHLYTHKHVE